MDKQADSGTSVTHLPIPLIGDINNRRFMTAVLAGALGGAGVSSAANLLRQFLELRQKRKEETDADTIVLNLPEKAAEAGRTGHGYEAMHGAKPGEYKLTTGGSGQYRERGKFGPKVKADASDTPQASISKAAAGNPGPNSVGTVVANALGLTAGGLLSYEVVSRLFDAMNERRLKRKLEAAQQAYVNALGGASKRAEAVNRILAPVEHVICKSSETKSADVADVIRYPAAAYILALLAGTGATAYVTKKVMDREFPEEKLKKDINRPTRIVFRTAPGAEPTLSEGSEGEEKAASAETCAALTAMLPIYMDVVEGQPSRTLAEPYRKIAEAAGTDAAGLLKMAQTDMSAVYRVLLSDPKALWRILVGTRFGLNFSKLRAANILRDTSPDTYRRAVDAAIDSSWANGPNDGFFRKAYNGIGKAMTHAYANLGGRDSLVEDALAPKAAEEVPVVLHPETAKRIRDAASYGEDAEYGKTYLKHLGLGTAAGALLGGAVGAVSGRKPATALSGSALGSLAGAGIGTVTGGLSTLVSMIKDKLERRRRINAILSRLHATHVPDGVSDSEALAPKAAEADSLLRAGYIGSSIFKEKEPEPAPEEPEPAKEVVDKAKKDLKAKRKVTVEAADPNAAAFVQRRKAVLNKLLARLNAQGRI